MSCYEGGYDGFWLHRFLCDGGLDNQFWTPPASWSTAEPPRRGCCARSWSWNVASPRVCRVVRVPSLEQENDRRRSRERAWLVNERGQHSSRVKGLLITQGIRDFKTARRDWREQLETLRPADGRV
ncbi:hypothetical protein [Mesorhizobium sp. M0053]|uniref:hypothetical protein n=1 Tax=Mesorhizobium sp. M0053 TaxID=2956864 RepID=UPI0033372153